MRVVVVGGGPAGLMAAEAAVARGATVAVFDQTRSVGRKLLVAGKGGLNLTHAEPLDTFLDRYGEARARLEPFVRAFPPAALRALADSLGQTTWVGSSGRVFPKDAKAAPLLRAWISRLKRAGVRFHTQYAWRGWHPSGRLAFRVGEREELVSCDACVLALGGGSWPRTGSDARWVHILRAAGVEVTPLAPANVGWVTALPPAFVEKWNGAAIKSIALSIGGSRAHGDAIVTAHGIEGTPVYRLGAEVRRALERGPVSVTLDLKADSDLDSLERRLTKGGSKSRSTKLAALALDDASRALAQALLPRETLDPRALAIALKSLSLTVTALRPLEEAISSAGGVRWNELTEGLMLIRRPGVFVAGEMIDWEAPTGGYLLQACFATGRAAGDAAASFAP